MRDAPTFARAASLGAPESARAGARMFGARASAGAAVLVHGGRARAGGCRRKHAHGWQAVGRAARGSPIARVRGAHSALSGGAGVRAARSRARGVIMRGGESIGRRARTRSAHACAQAGGARMLAHACGRARGALVGSGRSGGRARAARARAVHSHGRRAVTRAARALARRARNARARVGGLDPHRSSPPPWSTWWTGATARRAASRTPRLARSVVGRGAFI